MRAEGLLGVILPKDRDPRFVTIRRGGTLTDADHQLLALWAASCAEHVLDRFESARPQDPRPRRAIEQARAWPAAYAVWRGAPLRSRAAAIAWPPAVRAWDIVISPRTQARACSIACRGRGSSGRADSNRSRTCSAHDAAHRARSW